jgi:chemotaxis protein methyltransferase CheR
MAGLSSLVERSPNFDHVVFPDLMPAGIRHVINFAPTAVQYSRPCSEVIFSDEDDACLRWFFQQAGLRVEDYRAESLRRRIASLLRYLEAGSLVEARAVVRRNLLLLPRAMDALLIGVTSFFRDPDVFDSLRDAIADRLPSADLRYRVWSAGCSDGSELYSLAVLLGESGILARSSLLGTDCRASAIVAARRGSFSRESVRGVDAGVRRRFFHMRDGHWDVASVLKRHIAWRQADVLREIEPGPWDMILCRNVSIYLQPNAVHELWVSLRGVLRPGGLLVVGKAERPASAGGFVPVGQCIFERRE